MLLNEFFGPAIKAGKQADHDQNPDDTNHDELFWYIIDHDKLHKDFILPMLKNIKRDHEAGTLDKEKYVEEFMPMVNKGCIEFYHTRKMHEKLGKLFPKELREDLCERLYDHFTEELLIDKNKTDD